MVRVVPFGLRSNYGEKLMFPRHGGKLGEYLWDKEMERLERYKDRPWELQSRDAAGGPLFTLLFVAVVMVVGTLVLSSF